MPFTKLPGVRYRFDYYQIFDDIESGKVRPESYYRTLICEDLFFLTYFGLKIPCAHHPFWVQACADVDTGPKDRTLDIWGREHGKSTIITCAETIQDCLRVDGGCEERIGILSYNKTTAESFLKVIKAAFEGSEFLKACFPDILWNNPSTESPQWSLENGIILKRKGFFKEATIEAWGLIDGQPTGRHFTKRVYDDIVTPELSKTPERMKSVSMAFDLSENLGAEGGTVRVVGTTYDYNDTICYLKNQKDPVTGKPTWHVREKPSVEPRTFSGKPVFLSQKRIDRLKLNRITFAAQHLLDPQPEELQKLNPERIKVIRYNQVPKKMFKFVVVDPAGKEAGRDSWAIGLFGVEPYRDDIGASSVFLLDLVIEPMDFEKAIKRIVDIYIRAGRVAKLGIETPANSTWDVHVRNALKARKKFVSIEAGTLVPLKHGGRSKDFRIESALVWPLNNGKFHVLDSIPEVHTGRLREEMRKFPYWHDDGLDMCAYLYDLIKDYRFPEHEAANKREEDRYDRARRRMRREFGKPENSWLIA